MDVDRRKLFRGLSLLLDFPQKTGRKTRSDKQHTATASPIGSSPSLTPVTTAPALLNPPNVEFVNPKFKDEYLSRSDAGSSPNGPDNPWVWLNAYSRIPVSPKF